MSTTTAAASVTADATTASTHGHRRHMIAVVVLVPVLVALALWAFAWPAARLAPRDLPLGVAGPATAVTQVELQLSAHEGAFEIHRYADEAAARDAIEHRTVYGAVVVTAQGPKLLTASAASPYVAQLLQQAVTEQAARSGGPVPRSERRRRPRRDERPAGAAFGASVPPLAPPVWPPARGHPASAAGVAGPAAAAGIAWSGSSPPPHATAGSACSPATGGPRPPRWD